MQRAHTATGMHKVYAPPTTHTHPHPRAHPYLQQRLQYLLTAQQLHNQLLTSAQPTSCWRLHTPKLLWFELCVRASH